MEYEKNNALLSNRYFSLTGGIVGNFIQRCSTVSQCNLLSVHRKWIRLTLAVRLNLMGLIMRDGNGFVYICEMCLKRFMVQFF